MGQARPTRIHFRWCIPFSHSLHHRVWNVIYTTNARQVHWVSCPWIDGKHSLTSRCPHTQIRVGLLIIESNNNPVDLSVAKHSWFSASGLWVPGQQSSYCSLLSISRLPHWCPPRACHEIHWRVRFVCWFPRQLILLSHGGWFQRNKLLHEAYRLVCKCKAALHSQISRASLLSNTWIGEL